MITKRAKPVKTLVYKAFRGCFVRDSGNQEAVLSAVSVEIFRNVGQVVGQIQRENTDENQDRRRNYNAINKEKGGNGATNRSLPV